tara:strand:- start:1308 stop:1724 length:417 start_codon:yes stop_codon:yes gene_type:complete
VKKKDITKPVMLYAAEEIYLKVSEIKLQNPEISLIEAVERYIGSKSYQSLSSGEFHNELLKKLNKEKIPKKTIDLLLVQKRLVLEQLKDNDGNYFAKSSFPLSNSQTKFNLLWRMCESYELWCKEINQKKSITLGISD